MLGTVLSVIQIQERCSVLFVLLLHGMVKAKIEGVCPVSEAITALDPFLFP
jgi:hypothetical protein